MIKNETSMVRRDFTVGLQKTNLPEKIAHLTSRDFFDYFAVKYLKAKHKLCAIPYWLDWKVKKNSTEMTVPEYHLDQCIKSSERFVSIPLCLTSDEGGAHANALFIDKKNKTAERYEPHGARAYELFTDYKYEKFDTSLASFFKKKYGYEFIPPSNFLPALGPQSFEHYIDESGYCATWSLWYIDMRLTYPNVPREELVLGMFDKVHMLLGKPNGLTNYLVDYAKQVYAIMVAEFPHYKDYFINYDKHKKFAPKSAKGKKFDEFLDEMNQLVSTPLHINKPVALKGSVRVPAPPRAHSKDLDVEKVQVRVYSKKGKKVKAKKSTRRKK